MSLLTTLIAFIVTLGVLIFVHEYGHYWVARKCGVKVLRFSIGFGRPLARWVRGADRTEWTIGALPLGGYVRMLDERDADQPPATEAERARAFNRQPVGKRIAIVLAGPLANLLLAIAVYWGLNVAGVREAPALLGAPAADSPAARAGLHRGDRVLDADGHEVRSWNELSWLVLRQAVNGGSVELLVQREDAEPRSATLDLSGLTQADLERQPMTKIGLVPLTAPPRIGRLVEGGAAEQAGLRAQDQIVAIDGRAVGSAAETIAAIRAAPERALQLRVLRTEQALDLTVVPAAVNQPDGGRIGRIGAELGDRLDTIVVRYGPLEALGLAVERTGETIVFSLSMLYKMLVGEASLKNLSGPVTIADYAGKTASAGLAAYLGFLALVSISLGVLNLLPIPMLDGGHLLYYLIEIAKGSPVSDRWMDIGQRAGAAVLVMLTALALFNDFSRLLS
jgi:regulator of sigma E protease